jgi:hypothetical protein
MLKPASLLISRFSLLARIELCSRNTSIKSSRILKWNAGVRILRRLCHFAPINCSDNNYCDILCDMPVSICFGNEGASSPFNILPIYMRRGEGQANFHRLPFCKSAHNVWDTLVPGVHELVSRGAWDFILLRFQKMDSLRNSHKITAYF